MFYQLTEDEFNSLESAMRQMGFIYDLCTQHSADHFQQLDMRGLMAFVGAQENTISQALDAATERDKQRSAGDHIDAIDVINLVKMLAGNTSHIAPDAAPRIMRHLVAEAKDNTLYQGAVEDFAAYLVPVPAPVVEPPSKAAPRKRQRVGKGVKA